MPHPVPSPPLPHPAPPHRLQVGATFPATVPCHTCTCLSVDTQDPTVQCKEEACNTACPQVTLPSRADLDPRRVTGTQAPWTGP